MRILVSSAAALALLGGVSAAYADSTSDILNAKGAITSLDQAKHTVTLDNGSTYVAAPNVKLSDFKAGEQVKLSYFKSGDALDMMWMKRAG
jgi:hypothetical protein